ncbi:unnamed protein product [Pleuronectes platessa]|uniref:Uncharacterized protein n=1 Tax=Pleuronectes platessa TaxID=8262 RepID=A0A9N7U6Y1_PLEPL|nr:unnamed protein product [Pleuronectes platessa]
MVDAVVYMTRRTGGAEFLARDADTLGSPAFVEDETTLEGQVGFRLPLPSQVSETTAPRRLFAPLTSPVITELKLRRRAGGGVCGSSRDAPAAGPLVLVVVGWEKQTWSV